MPGKRAISYEERDAASSNGRLLRFIVHLREWRALLAVVWPSRFVRNNTTNIDRHLLRKIEVNVVEDLGVRLVHDWVVTVVEFKGDGGDEVLLLDGCERVVEELSLIEMLLEFSSSYALLNAFHFGRETAYGPSCQYCSWMPNRIIGLLTCDSHPYRLQQGGQ